MKKSLPKAIALAASLGAAASAHAVNHNPEGLGQVLLYPIYSVENGNSTAVHVTNTTNEFKAVKVRFLEGMNSQEVLDFNLYLSPYDVWTGIVTRTDGGAKLATSDKSCTAGNVGETGQEFRPTLFASSVPAEKVKTADRARVGHIEVIEMGVIDPNSADANVVAARNAIVHTNGVPGDCGAIRAAWQPSGFWRANPGLGMLAPTGGLYGSATLVNVNAGSEIAADAVALDNWSTTQVHALPGDEAPTLNAGDPVATFKDGSDAAFATGWDAVSAVLMKQNLQNDFVNGAGLNGTTDLVITFPTKRHYVNQGFNGATPNPALAPFTAPWVPADSSACEAIGISFYDREERLNFVEDDQISPLPAVPGLALCHETNVLGVGNSGLLGGAYVRNNVTIQNGFETGWVRVDFTNPNQSLTPTGGTVATPLLGLPAIGFAAINVVNGDVGGLLSNYSATYLHKATTSRDRNAL